MNPTIFGVTARAHVRTRPSRDAAAVDVLNPGARVNVVDIIDGWAETSEGEFVMIDFLERIGETSEVRNEE